MAVSENDLVVGPLIPAAGVTTISLDFFFENASWLEVYKAGSETPLVLNTDYTVAGAGSSSGVVTLTTAANGTDAYSVYLSVPLQRSSDMQLRGEFKSGPFNVEMDRLWQRLQHHNTLLGRTLQVGRTADVPEPYTPKPETVVGFDVAGGTTLYPVNAAVTLNVDPDDVIRRDKVAAVITDMAMGYTPGASVQVKAGQYVVTTAEGFIYKVAASTATDHHVTTAGGVKLEVMPRNGEYHAAAFGSPVTGAVVQEAIDGTANANGPRTTGGGGPGLGEVVIRLPMGEIIASDTVYLRRTGVKIRGAGSRVTTWVFRNINGGTVFAGDEDLSTSTAVHRECELSGFSIASNGGAFTDAARDYDFSVGINYTTFSNSHFDVPMRSQRENAILAYGQGNTGASPYSNNWIINGWYGGSRPETPLEYSQTGMVFASGTLASVSQGPNGNHIYCAGRSAALGIFMDVQCGQSNFLHNVAVESISDTYIRCGYRPQGPDFSGTSTGGGTSTQLIDTSASFSGNINSGAVKIVSGTGAGQVRQIGTFTSTTLNLIEPWGIMPDNTSQYEIYRRRVNGLEIMGARTEGVNGPKFLRLLPGSDRVRVANVEAQSLEQFVFDDSGCLLNSVGFAPGQKVVIHHDFGAPGPNADIDAFSRTSVFGGYRFAGNYLVEWVRMSSASGVVSGDTATLRLDVSGTGPGLGTTSLRCDLEPGSAHVLQLPPPDKKRPEAGVNRGLFLNLQTGANFPSGTRLVAAFCVTLL